MGGEEVEIKGRESTGLRERGREIERWGERRKRERAKIERESERERERMCVREKERERERERERESVYGVCVYV